MFIRIEHCILISILTISQLFSQKVDVNVRKLSSPLQSVVDVSKMDKDFFPALLHLEPATKGSQQYYLNELKKNIVPKSGAKMLNKGTLPLPVIKNGFEGNRYPIGVPNDNDMAISNDGKIVTVANTNLTIMDTTGAILKSMSLQGFINSSIRKENKYDPRVLYDPKRDRFVVAVLNSSSDAATGCFLAFSKTNDPMGEWNIFFQPGCPLNDSTWTDYPIIALSDKYLYLTLNAIKNGVTWELGFQQSYIFQMDLDSAFQGVSLKTKLYSDIKFDGKRLRNICPVQESDGFTNSTMYFVNNKNISAESDSFFLLSLNKSIDDVDKSIDIKLLKSPTTYGFPPNARQPKNRKFATNDARNLDALIHNGVIHIVGNTIEKSTNLATIFHGTINNIASTPTMNFTVLPTNGYELGYPGIAFMGKNSSEEDMAILANYVSDTAFGGLGCFYYKNSQYSDLKILKRGSSVVNVINPVDRWGDYSGIQRRYNKPSEVWLAGTFGYAKKEGIEIKNTYGTWISAVSPSTELIGIDEVKKEKVLAKVYPNPLIDNQLTTIAFTATQNDFANFSIYSQTGQLIETILISHIKAGKNEFTFSPKNLPSGMYILKIEGKSTHISHPIIKK
jgi:hypothetical protein